MGDGNFIIPINASLRKQLGKKMGDKLKVTIEADDTDVKLSDEFITCLQDDPIAYHYFKSLPGSHQRYFSKWIESAKTSSTKTNRIVMAVAALARKQGYSEMIRANKSSNPR